MHSSQQKCNNCSKTDLKKREKYKYLSVLVQPLSLSQGGLKYTLGNKNATNAVRQTLKKKKKKKKYKECLVLVQSQSLSQGELKYTLVNKNATNAVRQTLKTHKKVQGMLLGVGSVTVIITRGVKIHSSQQKSNKCSETDFKKEKSTRNTSWCWFSHCHYHKGS